jgi:hypothetical protein
MGIEIIITCDEAKIVLKSPVLFDNIFSHEVSFIMR